MQDAQQGAAPDRGPPPARARESLPRPGRLHLKPPAPFLEGKGPVVLGPVRYLGFRLLGRTAAGHLDCGSPWLQTRRRREGPP
jgi:hypothetical protein